MVTFGLYPRTFHLPSFANLIRKLRGPTWVTTVFYPIAQQTNKQTGLTGLKATTTQMQ